MADFAQFCNRFFPLEKGVLDELVKNTQTKTFKKGEYILKDGQVCRHLFFINHGLAKSFFMKDGKEFIMRFFAEDFMFSVFDSYVQQTPSNYAIIALEDTTVTLISHDKMEELCKKHHGIEAFFRRLVSLVTIRMMKRISGMLEENAAARYTQFVTENKDIIQRISLGDLAQYLGITQQSLSRIRAQK